MVILLLKCSDINFLPLFTRLFNAAGAFSNYPFFTKMVKKKTGYIICIMLLLCMGNLHAQSLPEDYNVSKRSRLLKHGSETPLGNSITDIITVGDTVWLGTSRGLSRSTDRGLSWTNYYGKEPFGEEEITSMAYFKGMLWVATNHIENINDEDIFTGSGLKFTTDNGNSWGFVPQPTDSSWDSSIVYGINRLRALPVTAEQQNLAWDIAITPGTVWIASWSAGIRKSTDLGKTWQRVLLPPDFLDSIKPTDTLKFSLQPQSGWFGSERYLNHMGFSILAVDSLTLYAGTAGGLNKSTDGGISWRKFTHQNQVKPISGNYVTSLAYDTLTKKLFAGSWRAEGNTEFYGLSYSDDGAESWNTALNGTKPYGFAFKDKDVITATDQGLFRSDDGGNTWVIAGMIDDKLSGFSIKTDVFYAASVEKNDLWIGSAFGLAKFTQTGKMWDGKWNVFVASQSLASEAETYAYPNPFSPDAEMVNIKYSTGKRTASVSIRIFDFGMNLVRTVIQNAVRGSLDESGKGVIDYWNGRDERGKIVPNGVYFYRIDIDNGETLYGKIMVLL
ncbi:MAG: hypothetical protein ACM3S2_17120 [Ignavibacteriales bacterium]